MGHIKLATQTFSNSFNLCANASCCVSECGASTRIHELNNPIRWLWRSGLFTMPFTKSTTQYNTMQHVHIKFSSSATLCTTAKYAQIRMVKLESFQPWFYLSRTANACLSLASSSSCVCVCACLFPCIAGGWTTERESRWCYHYLLFVQSKFAAAFAFVLCYGVLMVLSWAEFWIFCYHLLLRHIEHLRKRMTWKLCGSIVSYGDGCICAVMLMIQYSDQLKLFSRVCKCQWML